MSSPVVPAAVLLLAAGGPAFAIDLTPHRAIYDVSLAETSGESNLTGVTGRLVYELTGSSCAGFTTNSRFVIEFQQAQGAPLVSDLRTSSFEAADGSRFTFSYETFMDEVLTEESEGSAERTEDGIAVTVERPSPRSFTVPAEALFPNEMTRQLLEAAERGERFASASYFDGSSSEVDVYSVSAVIADGAEPPAGGDASVEASDLAGERGWQLALAYFDSAGAGDQSPSFTLSGNLYANGAAGDTTYNYGELAVLATLTHYEELPELACP